MIKKISSFLTFVLMLGFFLVSCNSPDNLSEYISKKYTVTYKINSVDKQTYELFLDGEGPLVPINNIKAHDESNPKKIVSNFYVGDEITMYYKNEKDVDPVYISVNRVEVVEVYIKNTQSGYTFNINKSNYPYDFDYRPYSELIPAISTDYKYYSDVIWETSNNYILFATFQEHKIINNIAHIYAYYTNPLYPI